MNNKRNKNKSNKKNSNKKSAGFASTSTAADTVVTEAISTTTATTSTTAQVDADADTSAGDEIFRVSDKANNSDTTEKKSVSNIKPGLVYETYNNIVDSYVSGIAVKPY